MKRILIADSHDGEATRLQQALDLQGYRTARLDDGGQFLGFCLEHQPDLVVIDVDLPVVNGWAAVHGLRAEASTAGIPAIALSVHSSEVEEQQALSIGFQRLMAKPLEMESLLAAIEEVINAGPATGVGLAFAEPAAAPSNAAAVSSPVSSPTVDDDEDCSFERVRGLAHSIKDLIDGLRPNTASLGVEGPELFGYIENGEKQISDELSAIEALGPEACANALYDKDLRHDIRNMIGSVTGFAELILMEPDIDPQFAASLTQIRQHSSEFVRLLDAQKAAAAVA